MSDTARFGRPRVSRFRAPALPPRRRTRVPLPIVVIGFVILLISQGGKIFAPASAPAPSGPAPTTLADVRAVDGDTLHAGALRIRLIGIDAPESHQTCRDARGQAYACGAAATQRLAALVAAAQVSCTAQGHDRYGRTLAVCATAQVDDVGRVLVREGLAVSYMDRDGRYGAAESAAREEGLGLWRGAFERPSDWRRRNRHQG